MIVIPAMVSIICLNSQLDGNTCVAIKLYNISLP